MDNMDLHMDLPMEDELATTLLSGGISPYMCLFFMKQSRRFFNYYHFRGAQPWEFQAWKDALLYFLKKVTWRSERLPSCPSLSPSGVGDFVICVPAGRVAPASEW